MSRALSVASLPWFLLACLAGEDDPPGNSRLGIATFSVSQTETRSTVVGLDSAGTEVGRLDLIHGRFALSGRYRADYDTDEVVGRRLSVAIAGQELVWETAGFEPTFHMPAHPAGNELLAAFLADDHVR